MTGPGGMATPLHHDQPQRALRNLGINSEEHTENPKGSRHMRKKVNTPFQHDENLANQPDSAYRRSAQQLPPRPVHPWPSQPSLRQRRPESSSPHGPLVEESPRHALSSSQRDRPHTRSFSEECRPSYLDRPHSEIVPESYSDYARSFRRESRPGYPDHPHAGSSPQGHSHHASMCDNQINHFNEEETLFSRQRRQAELQSSGAAAPIDRHVQRAKEHENCQPLQHGARQSSRPLDYKAAILRDISGSHALKHLQHVNHDNYFGSTEDDIQSKNSAKTLSKQQQQQQVMIDSCEIRHGNANDNSHEVAEKIESSNPITTSFSTHEDQAETDDEECDLMASKQSLQEGGRVQLLHRELSHSGSDDSFCHISKEAVEQEYQSECHLATPSEDPAQSQGQPCSRPIYDYARAGIRLVDDHSNEQRSDDKEGASNGEVGITAQDDECGHDDENGHDSQHQDVESPPLFLGFNHSSTRFACGTSKGLRVYDISTMTECSVAVIGGVGLVEMLTNSDSLILVGGGPNPSFPLNRVVMWDANKGKPIGHIAQKFPILAVKARPERLIVVVENEVCVYNLSNAKLLFQVNTTSNIKGLSAVSMQAGPSVMACPGFKKGEVRIEHIGTNREDGEMPTRNSIDISAHDSGLACVALNCDGTLLATASDRGTLVRIFNAKDGAPLQELRRGLDRAEIYSLAFSFSSDWLVVSSDKGTVHIFGVRTIASNSIDTNGAASPAPSRNPSSTLSFIKGVLPKYFRSEWSYAQFKLPEEMKSVVAFGQEKHSVLVLGTDGSFYKCLFDPEYGGDMKQLEFWNFLKPREAEA